MWPGKIKLGDDKCHKDSSYELSSVRIEGK